MRAFFIAMINRKEVPRMAEEKSLEELNEDLQSAVSEHGEDSDEAKSIQETIDELKEKGGKFDYKYVKELREEAKKYRTEKAGLKKDFEKVQKQLKEIEDAKLTDSEKDKNKITDLEKKLVDIQTEYKEKEIENLIVTVAASKNFADLEVVKMLAQKELASEEDIGEKAVDKVLDKIAKEKQYLIKGEKSATAGSGNFEKTGMEGKKTPDEMMGEFLHGEVREE